jgi:murein DD-endopeptidase MepM/ murein hydrolase activator NlpD
MNLLDIKFLIVSLSLISTVSSAFAVDSYFYVGNEFQKNLSCQRLAVRFTPYYILNSDLSHTNNYLRRGSFVDFRKDRILRSWNLTTENKLNVAITDNFLDTAEKWKIKVLSTQTDIPEISLTNKTLALQKSPDGRFTVHHCCTGTVCEVLPIYKVLDNNRLIAELSFHPKKSQFLRSYSLLKGTQSLVEPRLLPPTNTPAHPAPQVATAITVAPAVTAPVVTEASPTPQLAQNIICTRSDPLRIYDDSLQTVLYNIQRFQAIRVFQNWDGQREERQSGTTTYLKVLAHNARGEEIIGWAAANYIKRPEDCPAFGLVGSPSGETLIEGSTIVVDTTPGDFRFPTEQRPSSDYAHGAGGRYFGASRSGRRHAACDLLRPEGEKVFAVSGGTILQRYRFYEGTDAIEVKHDNGKVMRYGEVSTRTVAQSGAGDQVLKGQHIGYIAHLRMLHFEMYSGTGTGPLTVRGSGEYSRRSDLIDPTNYLKQWEEETF